MKWRTSRTDALPPGQAVPSRMASAAIEVAAQERARLLEQQADIKAQYADLEQMTGRDDAASAAARCDGAIDLMYARAETASHVLDTLADAHKAAGQPMRLFQAVHGVARAVLTPDPYLAFFLVVIGWLVETIFTAIGLFADGHVGLAPALGFAVTFATVNVGLGLALGQCLRFVGYHRNSYIAEASDAGIRRAAWAGVGVIAFFAVVMVFTGARVRVTGGHDNLFDYGAVPFTATFGDGLALVIIVAALLSIALSAAKSYSGFSDPIPGYAAHAGHVPKQIEQEADTQLEEAEDEIETVAEEAEDDILETWAAPDARATLEEDRFAHNAEVDKAKDRSLARAFKAAEVQSFVYGEETAVEPPDLSGFDALYIASEDHDAPASRQDMVNRLEQARAEALTRVRTAHTVFKAKAQSHHVLPPHSQR